MEQQRQQKAYAAAEAKKPISLQRALLRQSIDEASLKLGKPRKAKKK
jgi:hypothetical protein